MQDIRSEQLKALEYFAETGIMIERTPDGAFMVRFALVRVPFEARTFEEVLSTIHDRYLKIKALEADNLDPFAKVKAIRCHPNMYDDVREYTDRFLPSEGTNHIKVLPDNTVPLDRLVMDLEDGCMREMPFRRAR